MSRFVLLDAGPLAMAAHPRRYDNVKAWVAALFSSGVSVCIPEIADYEVRRELLRAKASRGVVKLDELAEWCTFLPLNTRVMRRAAQLWADMRNVGTPLAPNDAIDADVFLAAEAQLFTEDGHDIVVATSNVRHLKRLVDAKV